MKLFTLYLEANMNHTEIVLTPPSAVYQNSFLGYEYFLWSLFPLLLRKTWNLETIFLETFSRG